MRRIEELIQIREALNRAVAAGARHRLAELVYRQGIHELGKHG